MGPKPDERSTFRARRGLDAIVVVFDRLTTWRQKATAGNAATARYGNGANRILRRYPSRRHFNIRTGDG
jgi:hypothetical protein